jgi:hypothetical protein
MKNRNFIAAIALLVVTVTASCNKDQAPLIIEKDLNTSDAQDDAAEARMHRKKVDLGSAATFVILSKTGITDVFPSAITGNIGSSPITGATIHLTCTEVTGDIYSVNAAGPLPCRITAPSKLSTAIGDMQTAYTDAAGRINPRKLNLGAGNIGGKTLFNGLYKWTTGVDIPSDITINGSSTDIFIFQVSGTLKVSSGVKIKLTGGALAKNIIWQTTGNVTLGTSSHFEGNILSKTAINLKT